MKHDRRKFMKTQLMAGLGAISTTGMAVDPHKPDFEAGLKPSSPEAQRKHYQTSLGGPSPGQI
jgi:hypothetical protein